MNNQNNAASTETTDNPVATLQGLGVISLFLATACYLVGSPVSVAFVVLGVFLELMGFVALIRH